MTEEPKRRFSKKILVWNMIGTWALLCFAAWFGEIEAVITHCFGFMVTILGLYIGVGHLDYRKVLENEREELAIKARASESTQEARVVEVST